MGLAAAAVLTAFGLLLVLLLFCVKAYRHIEARSDAERPAFWPWAGWTAAALVALGAIPFAASARAEAVTGWIDLDGDGMEDPMINGSYDWFDVNGGAMARWWIGGILLAGAAFAAAGWLVDRSQRSPDRAPSR